MLQLATDRSWVSRRLRGFADPPGRASLDALRATINYAAIGLSSSTRVAQMGYRCADRATSVLIGAAAAQRLQAGQHSYRRRTRPSCMSLAS